MAKKYDIITKGVYEANQPQNAIPLRNYILLGDNGKKYALLRFFNPRRQKLTALELKITAFDHRGNVLSERTEMFYKLSGKPLKEFVLTKKIEVDPESADFKIEVIKAKYGQYEYSCQNGQEKADYCMTKDAKFNVDKALDKLAWEKSSVKECTDNQRALIGVVSIILIAALLIFTVFQLIAFTKLQDTFYYSGVEYAFTDNKKDKGMSVYVVGVRAGVSNITIPEEIEGRKVTKIQANAFFANARIRSLTVDGAIVIEDNAFTNCTKLEKVNLPKAISIGKESFKLCVRLSQVTCGNLEKIENYAFSGCRELKTVTITSEKKVVSIGSKVFENCTSLENVDISSKANYTAYDIFQDCTSIKNLKLNNFATGYNKRALTSLFGSTQVSKLNLESVEIANLDGIGENFLLSVPLLKSLSVGKLDNCEVGKSAFSDCKNFAELKLPAPITMVGDGAFKNTSIAEFDFSATTYIGVEAFFGTKLDIVEIPILEHMGKGAFANSKISAITIPSSLSEIGEGAFMSCFYLTAITIPSTIREIGFGALQSCIALADIKLPFTGQSRDSQNSHIGYIFGAKEGKASASNVPVSLSSITLTEGDKISDYAFSGCYTAKNIVFPENITSIGEYAFYNCSAIKNINIPSSVQSIGSFAFAYCGGLTDFTIPDNLTSIGGGVLYGCNNVKQLTMPYTSLLAEQNGETKVVTFLSLIYNNKTPTNLEKITITKDTEIFDSAFEGCTKLKEVKIPNNVTRIGDSAFKDCAIADIVIPDTVIEIGENAFEACKNLLKFTIPASVQKIGKETTFKDCIKLWEVWNYSGIEGIKTPNGLVYNTTDEILQKFMVDGYEFGYDKHGKKYYLLDYPTSQENLVLPSVFTHNGETVTEYTIHSYFFDGNSKIKTMSIPANVIKISDYAFANCDSLKSVVFSEEAKFTEIGKYAFLNCTSLTNIVFPKSVTNILESAFKGCTALETFTSLSLKEIGDCAFIDCSALKTIKLNEGIARVGNSAFKNCTNLLEPAFKEGLVEIGNYAFENCTSMRSFDLPTTAILIGFDAFMNCNKLLLVRNQSMIIVRANSYENGSIALNAVFVTQKDDAMASGYTEHDGVSYLFYRSDFVAIGFETKESETLTLDTFVFGEKEIDSIAIYPGAFSNKDKLKTVIIGSVVKQIGNSAFAYCQNLESVDMSKSSLEQFSDSVFASCTNLKKVSLPSTLKNISNFTFSECITLQDISIPQGVISIGTQAFAHCIGLQSIELPDSVEQISPYAFDGCSNVKTLHLGAGVISIGNSAFRGLGQIESVVIPKPTKSIADGAFSECYKLLVVYNLSGLQISERNQSYGWVAFYALVVFKDLNQKVDFHEVTQYSYNYKFAKIYGTWYLYTYSLVGSVSDSVQRLPDQMNEYVIKDYTFEKIQANIVIIPLQVKSIQERAFLSTVFLTICYKGSEDEWKQIRSSRLAAVHVRFYVNCVHDEVQDNQWTFIVEPGKPEKFSTEVHYYEFDYRTIKAATCTESGEEEGTCKNCKVYKTRRELKALGHIYSAWVAQKLPTCTEAGKEIRTCTRCNKVVDERATQALGHSYNSDGNCTRCGKPDPDKNIARKKQEIETEQDNSTGA